MFIELADIHEKGKTSNSHKKWAAQNAAANVEWLNKRQRLASRSNVSWEINTRKQCNTRPMTFEKSSRRHKLRECVEDQTESFAGVIHCRVFTCACTRARRLYGEKFWRQCNVQRRINQNSSTCMSTTNSPHALMCTDRRCIYHLSPVAAYVSAAAVLEMTPDVRKCS